MRLRPRVLGISVNTLKGRILKILDPLCPLRLCTPAFKLQESGDEDPESRHGEGPVGGYHKVRDPRLFYSVRHRGRPRCYSCSLIGKKSKRWVFLDEKMCCCVICFSSARLSSLYFHSAFCFLDNGSYV